MPLTDIDTTHSRHRQGLVRTKAFVWEADRNVMVAQLHQCHLHHLRCVLCFEILLLLPQSTAQATSLVSDLAIELQGWLTRGAQVTACASTTYLRAFVQQLTSHSTTSTCRCARCPCLGPSTWKPTLHRTSATIKAEGERQSGVRSTAL